MSLSKTEKQGVMATYQRKADDTGSPEVQIALLTAEIKKLQGHFAVNKKDHHSRTGLIRKVNLRRKLLKYLKLRNEQSYKDIVTKLQLRH